MKLLKLLLVFTLFFGVNYISKSTKGTFKERRSTTRTASEYTFLKQITRITKQVF